MLHGIALLGAGCGGRRWNQWGVGPEVSSLTEFHMGAEAHTVALPPLTEHTPMGPVCPAQLMQQWALLDGLPWPPPPGVPAGLTLQRMRAFTDREGSSRRKASPPAPRVCKPLSTRAGQSAACTLEPR
jgi:hypothetical protein